MHTPAALGFELVEVVPRSWFEPQHTTLLTRAEVSPGANPRLAIRPLVLSDSGNWVKKSLSWRTIDRMVSQFGVDPRHQEWFSQLAGLRTRARRLKRRPPPRYSRRSVAASKVASDLPTR